MDHSVIIFLIALLIVAIYTAWFFPRSRALLHAWAAANHYEILHAESRSFRRGPLLWTSSKNQAVFFVKVRDKNGQERSGWLCLGGFWTGLFSRKSHVKWDNELPQHSHIDAKAMHLT